MRTLYQRSATLVAAVVLTCLATAHVRLIYSGNGNVLYWNQPQSVSIVLNKNGSDDVANGSDIVALRNAVAAWNEVDGTPAALLENASAGAQVRTDYASDDIHLMLFDEDGSSGWFPGGSGTVAITPISFYTAGSIIDADVLFNGRDYGFTTSGQSGRFDIQDVATHELGHLLGLDHSGMLGASMYPYVDPTVILHRSLSLDDVHGLRAMYPSGSFGSVTGNLTYGSGGGVPGAHLIIRDSAGRTVGATISSNTGSFTLRALDPGSYRVWAHPLDQPVSAANLTAGHSIATNFEATDLGSVIVTAGNNTGIGTQSLGGNVSLSLGRVADDYPLRVISGQTVSRLVRGSGLVSGSSLLAADPTISLVPTNWGNSYVQFQVTVPSGALPGHIDLLVTNSAGDQDLLPGALEVTPPDPLVGNVSPATGDSNGGSSLTLTGSNFRAGSRVVVGDRVYADGALNGCSVLNSTTITLSLQATVVGVHDVVVIDPSGVEGRALSAFSSQGLPVIASLFPVAGDSDGGTLLVLSGANFAAGGNVTINGVPQTDINVASPDRLEIITEPGTPGGPYVLRLTNPDMATAAAAFTYVNQDDPVVGQVVPASGTEHGGETITIVGSGFTPATLVRFGVHPDTGAGGLPASSVQFVDASTLVVVTPASSSSLETVMVKDGATEQGDLQGSAFAFLGTTVTTVGFGSCHAVAPSGPLDRQDAWDALLWIFMLVGASVLHRRTS